MFRAWHGVAHDWALAVALMRYPLATVKVVANAQDFGTYLVLRARSPRKSEHTIVNGRQIAVDPSDQNLEIRLHKLW